MHYFVNENIFTLNSGTEFSAVQRLKLFHAHGLEAKIVTRNYNPQLLTDIARVGLTREDILNMYDTFQETTEAPERESDVRYVEAIDKKRYHIEGVDANKSLIKHEGKTNGQVNIAPATVGIVGSIDWFNDMNNRVAQDIWDRRGFKSSTQYFHPDGTLGAQVFFNLKGEAKLEITHMFIKGKLFPTLYKLLGYQGRDWRFNTEEALFTFFLNSLNRQKQGVFFNDRPSLVPAVANIQKAKGRWQVLHTIHTEPAENKRVGASRKVDASLKALFTTYNGAFDGLIVGTAQQKQDIEKFFSFKQILVLPDSFAKKVETRRPAEARDLTRLLYVGRLSNEKHPLDALEILQRARIALPHLKLDFYGYSASPELQETLEKEAAQRGLKDAVSFKGYQIGQTVTDALDHAAFLLNPSLGEGFGMNILEALSHGLPVVAYKVKYGPSTLIANGKNGYLLPYGSTQGAADSIVEALSTPGRWEALSQAAVATAAAFDEEAVWTHWLNSQKTTDRLLSVE
jgi:poly(glycerol-phosphate) alpha-glucosyltransferase